MHASLAVRIQASVVVGGLSSVRGIALISVDERKLPSAISSTYLCHECPLISQPAITTIGHKNFGCDIQGTSVSTDLVLCSRDICRGG